MQDICQSPPVLVVLFSVLLPGLLLSLPSSAEIARHKVAVSELKMLPPGVTLPVRLGRSLRAGRAKVGTQIVAKTTQRVPVGEHAYLGSGAEVEGVVVASTAGSGTTSTPAILSIEFTQLHAGKQTISIKTKAIAIANFVQVGDTYLPVTGGADRGNSSEASWTTMQVGGEEVVRSGWVGPVVGSGLATVGHADYYGVYSMPVPMPNGGAPLPRALGVFSTTAAGLYGFEDGSSLRSAGGTITVTGQGKTVELRNGDHLLLEVIAPS